MATVRSAPRADQRARLLEVALGMLEESGPEALVSHLATTSMFLTMEAGERERRLAEVREIASRYGDRFAVPRQTYVFAFERVAG